MRFGLLVLALATSACQAQPANQTAAVEPAIPAEIVPAKAVTLKAADGVTVHGEYYEGDRPKALILLFHQAGSNKAEYATIAPRLVEAGYSALAIDQRSGGSMFGAPNQTVANLGSERDYLEARRDLDAALAWAADKRLPVILWGSSYSSSLIFLVAADNPGKLAGLLAFSPGEYLGEGAPVAAAAAKVSAPVYVTSASAEDEIAAARAIAGAVPGAKTQFVPTLGGIHGSSTLIVDRNATGAEENWRAVTKFLNGLAL